MCIPEKPFFFKKIINQLAFLANWWHFSVFDIPKTSQLNGYDSLMKMFQKSWNKNGPLDLHPPSFPERLQQPVPWASLQLERPMPRLPKGVLSTNNLSPSSYFPVPNPSTNGFFQFKLGGWMVVHSLPWSSGAKMAAQLEFWVQVA